MPSEPLSAKFKNTIHCASLADSQRLAQSLAVGLRAGHVVLLDGDLGAGKTTFISHLCASLGVAQQVSSPTYTISNLYNAPAFSVFHIDAYRMKGAREFYLLGLDEYFDESLLLIEWGQRVENLFPEALKIQIDSPAPGTESRIFHLSAQDGSWQAVLDGVSA